MNGRGEFLDKDVINGKAVIVRWLWTDLESDTPKFEQAFSIDEGKSWEANWKTTQTRKI